MLYQPQTIRRMWDTWLFRHQGTFFLFYLATDHSPGEGVHLATSEDGVRWQEQGLVLPKSEGAQWLGSGSIWPDPLRADRFLMNISEWYGPAMLRGQQQIVLAESNDLRHWRRLDARGFRPDPRWYAIDRDEQSRWDCISVFSRGEGGLFGYWTANPLAVRPGFGFGVSADGRQWQALEPPRIEWGEGEPPTSLEVGGVAVVEERVLLLAGVIDGYKGWRGMLTLVAERPEGPFRPAERNLFVLASPGLSTYFARFCPTPDGLLVNHHSITRADATAFAPLKRAVFAPDGTLYLAYWEGNDGLKGAPIACPQPAPNEPEYVLPAVDLAAGAVLEASVLLPEQEAALWPSLRLSCADGSAATLRCGPQGVVEIGVGDGEAFTCEERVDRDLRLGPRASVRLLLRGAFAELYLDNFLIQCVSLPTPAAGVVRLHNASRQANWSELRASQMRGGL